LLVNTSTTGRDDHFAMATGMGGQERLRIENFIHVVGGQYGSEGKGRVVGAILDDDRMAPHVTVRVGGPQAGHTIYLKEMKLVFKQLPIGAAYGKLCIIGRNAIIDPELLFKEMSVCTGEVVVDPCAVYFEKSDSTREQQLQMFESIGSTQTGVGSARAAHVMRTATLVGQEPWRLPPRVNISDTKELVTQALDKGKRVMIEGTQGIGLGLSTGGHYPYATSIDLTPAATLASMGFSLHEMTMYRPYVLGVFRTYPIRVAGTSGPLHRETSWAELRAEFGDHIPIEMTTVTKRIRRVGHWDADLARRSIKEGEINGAFYTFLDYIHPESVDRWRRWVATRELELGIPTVGISTSSGHNGKGVLWTN